MTDFFPNQHIDHPLTRILHAWIPNPNPSRRAWSTEVRGLIDAGIMQTATVPPARGQTARGRSLDTRALEGRVDALNGSTDVFRVIVHP